MPFHDISVTGRSIHPNVAKVEGAVASRRKEYSCSTLPQTLYNDEDAVASAFP